MSKSFPRLGKFSTLIYLISWPLFLFFSFWNPDYLYGFPSEWVLQSHRLSSLTFILLCLFYSMLLWKFHILTHLFNIPCAILYYRYYYIFHLIHWILRPPECPLFSFSWFLSCKEFILFSYLCLTLTELLSLFSCNSWISLIQLFWILYQLDHNTVFGLSWRIIDNFW